MKAHAITDYIHCIHADIDSADLFEGIWPLPKGVSLNSYVVKGEKTALIDLFQDRAGAPAQMEQGLASLGLSFSDLDYLIFNHLEPDHTGWLREFRKINPRAVIIATAKGIELVKSFYKIDISGPEPDCLRAVKDGDTLDLGAHKVLSFFETPNLHWPETMVTWESGSGTLFSCDAFGSYGSLGSRIFDDEFSPAEHDSFEAECLRYYANIISSFSGFVSKAIDKLVNLDIRCVAPSHGMVWRKNPRVIIERYAQYASWSQGPAKPEITVIWGSMYGNTRAGLDAVIRGIDKEGIPWRIHQVPDENISGILADAYRSSALVLAMPTYEYAMFPPMAYVLDIFRRKHIFGKKVLRLGAWGWIGGARKEYEAAIASLKWTSLESIEWAGYPDEEVLESLEARGRELARMLKTD